MFRKKVLFMVLFALTASAVTACGAATETSEAPAEETPAAAVTEAEISAREEITEEEITETIAEEETTETIAGEEVTETIAEEETTEEVTEEEPQAQGEIPTNAELLNMINQAFGIMTDNTPEGDISAAKDWDIIDENADIQTDAPITAEFLVSAAMRATGLVTGSSSSDEIIDCALERGVIDSRDLSGVDVYQAADIVEKAKYAWTHQEFRNEIKVELQDGVIDLTERIPVEDISIEGNTIEIPAGYATDITAGTVYILPKNPETGEGGAYKAESVTEDVVGGTVIIKSIPAEIAEVYKSISSH